jgi:1-deoxy-D-xylulose-5-phosphate reductoisomerase
MKTLSILGSTGSIGRNTLGIAARFPDRFRIAALAAHSRIDRLAEQVASFQPDVAVVATEALAGELRSRLSGDRTPRILWGESGYCEAAAWEPADMVVTAVVGAAGLLPTLAAIDAGKDIALANKETLVVAGELVTGAAAAKGVRILPVDSEHSAIFQCLAGNRGRDVDQILLTASGGPFRDRPRDTFAAVTPEQALKHPNWQMGPKITIDSATMMNKGLEVIEAHWLFDVDFSRIRVVLHPQSVIHSMVAYRDGAVLAQLGVPDMKSAIAYALSYPERLPLGQPLPDFDGGSALTFAPPDVEKFPCLALAYAAGRAGGTLPAVLNAANEVAVQAFLQNRISFDRIPQLVALAMEQHTVHQQPDLEQLLAADRNARRQVRQVLENEKIGDDY